MKLHIWDNTRTVEVSDEHVADLKTLGHTVQHRYLEYILRLEGITENSNLSDEELQAKVDALVKEEIEVRVQAISLVLKKKEVGEL